MKFAIIIVILYSCLILAGTSPYPTEYVSADIDFHNSSNIQIGNVMKIEPNYNSGILTTASVKSTLDDFTGFSIRIKGELPDRTRIIARLFWSYDGNKWLGPIVEPEIEPNIQEGFHDGYLYANPYWTAKPPAKFYRAELKLYGNGNTSPIIERIDFVFMDCGWTDYNVKTVSPLEYPMPEYVSRGPDGWNCDVPDTFYRGTPIYFDLVTHITIHHTAGATSTPSDPCAQMRNIWNYHVHTRGWNDIGYNFVLDHLGNIYHGRYCADLSTMNVQGAHVSYHNYETMGFSVMGNFETDTVCHATLNAIYDLISWKCDQYGIDPYGSDWNGDGEHRYYVPTILGHRDWPDASTACPGANFYPLIPSIRDSVFNRLYSSGGTDSIIVDNGDPEFSIIGVWYDGTYSPSSGWDNDYMYCNAGGDIDRATWTPELPNYAQYDIYMWWYGGSNRCNNIPIRIVGTEQDTVIVSQRDSGSDWHYLGRFAFDSGTSGFVQLVDSGTTDGSVVVADAVMWIFAEPLSTPDELITHKPNNINIFAYPNPFNSSVAITIETQNLASLPTIAIYDLRGNIVTSFDADGSLSPSIRGTNERSAGGASRGFIWTPAQSVPSGIYLIYATMSDEQKIAKRIIYLK